MCENTLKFSLLLNEQKISINPDFLKFLVLKEKKKKKKPSFRESQLKPNDVKKLIARIKEHQRKR